MSKISASLRQLVIQRANNRCEYCTLSQIGQEATFHIDHVIPVAANGKTVENNLALACVSCSLHKAAQQAVEDPDTGQTVNIFNPRQQVWKEHFVWDGVRVVGLTATGRATIKTLRMNRAVILAIRGYGVYTSILHIRFRDFNPLKSSLRGGMTKQSLGAGIASLRSQ